MLICTEPVSTPSTLQCRLTLPDIMKGSRNISFKVEGKWCRENQRTGWFELGCVFVDLSQKCRQIIDHLIKDWMTVADTTDTIFRGMIPR